MKLGDLKPPQGAKKRERGSVEEKDRGMEELPPTGTKV